MMSVVAVDVVDRRVDGLAPIRAEKLVVPSGPNDRRRFDNAEIGRLQNGCRTVADRIGQIHITEHAIVAHEHPTTVFGWCECP